MGGKLLGYFESEGRVRGKWAYLVLAVQIKVVFWF